MSAVFKDYFSTRAAAYRHYRPGYPDALYAFLAAQSPRRRLAWDCATGSGQVARGLAPRFSAVVATDASVSQLREAVWHPHIVYRAAPAEAAPFADRSVDLVTVAQALHWFDIDTFFAEVRRVLVPGGLLALWSYSLLSVSPPVDELIGYLYRDVLGDYWPPERRLVESGYDELKLPFEPIAVPTFCMSAHWRLPQLLGYLGTWSAVRAYRRARGADGWKEERSMMETEWRNQLQEGAERLGISLSGRQQELFMAYLALLRKWNRVFNLTAVKDDRELVPRHLVDSLSVAAFVAGPRVADVGTGAGLPGIPLALLRPDWAVTLVDTNSKKTRFLTQVKLELGLGNCEVVHARVETLRPDAGFDTVISRAFSTLAEFWRLASHLLVPGGRLVAMKGRRPDAEVAELPAGIFADITALESPPGAGERHVVVLQAGNLR